MFAIEQLPGALAGLWIASYYRSIAQAEIDLVLETPRNRVVAIEIKRSLSPRVSRGFRHGAEDVRATERYYATPAGDRFRLGDGIEAIPLTN